MEVRRGGLQSLKVRLGEERKKVWHQGGGEIFSIAVSFSVGRVFSNGSKKIGPQIFFGHREEEVTTG